MWIPLYSYHYGILLVDFLYYLTTRIYILNYLLTTWDFMYHELFTIPNVWFLRPF